MKENVVVVGCLHWNGETTVLAYVAVCVSDGDMTELMFLLVPGVVCLTCGEPFLCMVSIFGYCLSLFKIKFVFYACLHFSFFLGATEMTGWLTRQDVLLRIFRIVWRDSYAHRPTLPSAIRILIHF